jgi:sugar-specific transcriptional regulator TrmB/DNA-binding CsgD family transcriptional regulator
MLTVLGASPDEDAVYGFLASRADSATASEIASGTALAPAVVDSALVRLVGRGLAIPVEDEPPRYVAAPLVAVQAMIADRLKELHEAQVSLDHLATQRRSVDDSGTFEVLRGEQQLRQALLRLFASARTEVLNLAKPPITVVRSEERVEPGEGVVRRGVFETEVMASPETLEAVRENLRPGDEVRVHTRLPVKLLAFDREVALLPLRQQDATPVGVLIRESALLDALLELFDYVWATAVPLHLDNQNSPAPREPFLSVEERQLLSLLLAGLTDEAIAVHHGTSARTVQRRVHALMHRAQVRTRMQLAWEAARRGWV